MGKALKTFIILNLVMSAVVIWLGIQNFSERKLLKAETLELETTLSKIPSSLQWNAQPVWEEDRIEGLDFKLHQPTTLAELENIRIEGEKLSKQARNRQGRLLQVFDQLTATKRNLESTNDNLAARTRELAAAEKQEQELTVKLSKTNTELSTAKNQVSTLESTLSTQRQDIDSKNNSITDLTNELASFEIDLESRIQERDTANAEYQRCKDGEAGKEQRNQNARGKKGLVLAVNNDWEYVVIEKGETEIEPNFEAFVHRGKEFVGKLSILRVEDDLAIAEIVADSLAEGDRIKPGDTLFF
ncbi:hypothetical protein P0Y35_15865 [Kiritimatiellaeota bacterium B1221]|nr:hypothetical protein [Kiritimatiellaeota bacterium B1221]